MTQTLEEFMEGSETGPKDHPGHPKTRRVLRGRTSIRRGRIDRRFVTMMVIAAIGLGLVLYPQAADWFSSISHNSKLSGYAQEVDQLEPSARTKVLDRSREYNSRIPTGQLRDPYSAHAPATALGGQLSDYQSQLNVANDEVIGRFRYPSVKIDLPVFHGTSEEVLAKGVGHLYGSSLPVGGPGTHSVLTSHSGIPNAELFNPLHSAKTGDIFSTEVMDHTFLYKVNKIEVVKPDDISSLKITASQDSITLITCTPIGVNSHRLLVHASRIADIPKEAPEQKTLAGRQTNIGFPFWAVYFIGGLLVFYLASRAWDRRPKR
ncbi:class C sortase [Arthrobacter sp. B2a2-09]|uniref:class C sortase n=1 Tax=Arthrobacter sp. B2a2-09 TaxID=2952822 RepID=UPI0022CD303F|nr:class C sortase [Arthrobacter sp. B2a2-09]MCZ9882119.1 class C sortase [Arthrobacter sp. B2a2-09]